MAKAEKEIPVHRDFLTRPLAVGDFVVMIKPHYRSLQLVRVVSFTPKFVNVEWGPDHNGNMISMRQESSQLCIVDGPDLTAFLLCK